MNIGVDDLRVHKQVYHRNGVCGIGFYTLLISWRENGYRDRRHAIATVSTDDIQSTRDGQPFDPSTRVLMIGDFGGVDIEQTMRGDHFSDELCRWVIADEDKTHKERRVRAT